VASRVARVSRLRMRTVLTKRNAASGNEIALSAALGAMPERELSLTQSLERPGAMRGGCIRRLVRNELHEKQGSIAQKTIKSGSVWKMSNKFCQSKLLALRLLG